MLIFRLAPLGLAVAALVAISQATPASGESTTGVRTMSSADLTAVSVGPVRSVVTDKCAEVSDYSPSYPNAAVLDDCRGSGNQNWILYTDGTLRTAGQCLSPAGPQHSNQAGRTVLEIADCTGSTSQIWQVYNGGYLNQSTNLCLDDPYSETVNGVQLDLAACDGSDGQTWSTPGGRVGSAGGYTATSTIEAENYTAQQGTGVVQSGSTRYVGYVGNGDWLAYDNVNFGGGLDTAYLRYASNLGASPSGSVEIHLDSRNGPSICTFPVGYTGGWTAFTTVNRTPTTFISGFHKVYLRFVSSQSADFVNVDWTTYSG